MMRWIVFVLVAAVLLAGSGLGARAWLDADVAPVDERMPSGSFRSAAAAAATWTWTVTNEGALSADVRIQVTLQAAVAEGSPTVTHLLFVDDEQRTGLQDGMTSGSSATDVLVGAWVLAPGASIVVRLERFVEAEGPFLLETAGAVTVQGTDAHPAWTGALLWTGLAVVAGGLSAALYVQFLRGWARGPPA